MKDYGDRTEYKERDRRKQNYEQTHNALIFYWLCPAYCNKYRFSKKT